MDNPSKADVGSSHHSMGSDYGLRLAESLYIVSVHSTVVDSGHCYYLYFILSCLTGELTQQHKIGTHPHDTDNLPCKYQRHTSKHILV